MTENTHKSNGLNINLNLNIKQIRPGKTGPAKENT